MQKFNWDSVPEAGEKVPAGGYVCQIINVVDEPKKEYLLVEFDIANTEYAGAGARRYEANNGQYGYYRMYRSYKETAKGMFKAFLNRLEESNQGIFSVRTWDCDERKLRGLYFGAVLAEEEYLGNDGKVKTRLNAHKLYNTEDILNEKFVVPPLKKLENAASFAPAPFSSFGDEAPF